MFKLDKSNQKQVADMLHDLVEQLDGSGFDLSYLEVAANIVRLYEAPERDTKEYWNLTKWTWKKNEPSYDPEPDIMSNDIAEDGTACEWCGYVMKHDEPAYTANDLQSSIICKDCYE
jgi:hypothetical protein